DELHVEMALSEGALRRLSARGECRHQDVVERSTVGNLLLECFGPRPQLVVGQGLDLLLERVDLRDPRHVALDAPLVRGTEQLASNGANHEAGPLIPAERALLA